MTDMTIDEEARLYLEITAERLTRVREGECLFCYVARMLEEHGCDTSLRFTRLYRERRAPRATSLERRLGAMGGFCDCEILLNAMSVARSEKSYDEGSEEWLLPEPRAACRGVRRGSTQSCGIWERRRRGEAW
ncbi:MAG TPA: DUF2695 domain-containing protein [Nocardioides sp.]|jgi:hypothetical protein|uniref:DUF2695 domain-containing protein n=1 Tax=Nocardioides sp. TaxID=35761 RepID=UPI002E31620C|nr:DUF2695 domain-containing protein [Nocardioides sp.]HEX3930917.1 DUF2695 domain-containing protein [Nocardioides sp.]